MKLKISVDNKSYEVDVDVLEDQAAPAQPAYRPTYSGSASVSSASIGAGAASAAGESAESVADESKVCRSPIVGIVIKVTASIGQEVKAGEQVMVLEAMKMESPINSPIDGKIKEIKAAEGDSVQLGQVLVVFE